MRKLLVSAGLSVLGMLLMLAWWSIRGGSDHAESLDKIPSKVWAGGAGKLTIEAETTCAAQMRINFEEHDKDITSRRNLETWEKTSAGTHSWTVDVPAGVGGYIELNADNPQVGDKLSWKIRANDQILDERSETLQEALQPKTAFFLQVFYEDYSKARNSED